VRRVRTRITSRRRRTSTAPPRAGFVFFTIDPSDHVDGKTDGYSKAELDEKLGAIRGEVEWVSKYRGKSLKLPTGTTVTIDDQAVARCAVEVREGR